MIGGTVRTPGGSGGGKGGGIVLDNVGVHTVSRGAPCAIAATAIESNTRTATTTPKIGALIPIIAVTRPTATMIASGTSEDSRRCGMFGFTRVGGPGEAPKSSPSEAAFLETLASAELDDEEDEDEDVNNEGGRDSLGTGFGCRRPSR